MTLVPFQFLTWGLSPCRWLVSLALIVPVAQLTLPGILVFPSCIRVSPDAWEATGDRTPLLSHPPRSCHVLLQLLLRLTSVRRGVKQPYSSLLTTSPPLPSQCAVIMSPGTLLSSCPCSWEDPSDLHLLRAGSSFQPLSFSNTWQF